MKGCPACFVRGNPMPDGTISAAELIFMAGRISHALVLCPEHRDVEEQVEEIMMPAIRAMVAAGKVRR